MYGIHAVYLAVSLSVLGTTYGDSPSTGKCRNEGINGFSLDFKRVGTWNVVYVTETELVRNVDRAYYDITPSGDNTYKLTVTKVLKDGNTFIKDHTLRVADNHVYEESVQNGILHKFKVYTLNKINDDAFLCYHCSDEGSYPDDMRFIFVRKGTTLSDDSMKQLLDTDKSYGFKGNLVKVPNVEQ